VGTFVGILGHYRYDSVAPTVQHGRNGSPWETGINAYREPPRDIIGNSRSITSDLRAGGSNPSGRANEIKGFSLSRGSRGRR
jgi:hypothetical protein